MGYATDLWKIVLNSNCSEETRINIKNGLDELNAKAKAWDNYLADVENSVREVTGNENEVKWHVDYAINEYKEDKKDDTTN